MSRERSRLPVWARCRAVRPIVVVLLSAPMAFGMLASPASGSAASDRASIDRYLSAELKFVRDILISVPASVTVAEATAQGIEVGCPNVLASAPAASFLAAGARWPKQLNPQIAQLRELEEELSGVIAYSTAGSEQSALTSFIDTLRGLHWRDRELARAARVMIQDFERPPLRIPDACVDMRSWAASGYLLLPQETTGFLASKRAGNPDAPSIPRLVRNIVERRGTRFERATVRSVIEVASRIDDAFGPLTTIIEQLNDAMGLGSNSPPPAAVLIGRGTTAAHTKFIAKVTPSIKLCLPSLNITETDGPLISSFGGRACTISTDVPAEQSVHCDVGLLRVQARALPAARSVRLLLSNGLTIDSPVLLIPANVAGAPGGFYYQAVPGPWPIPISLTELDAEGHPLAVLKLRTVRHCAFR